MFAASRRAEVILLKLVKKERDEEVWVEVSRADSLDLKLNSNIFDLYVKRQPTEPVE